MSNLIKDGSIQTVYVPIHVKWVAYKPGAPKKLLKQGGRWKKANEHGGWDNCQFNPEEVKEVTHD